MSLFCVVTRLPICIQSAMKMRQLGETASHISHLRSLEYVCTEFVYPSSPSLCHFSQLLFILVLHAFVRVQSVKCTLHTPSHQSAVHLPA